MSGLSIRPLSKLLTGPQHLIYRKAWEWLNVKKEKSVRKKEHLEIKKHLGSNPKHDTYTTTSLK